MKSVSLIQSILQITNTFASCIINIFFKAIYRLIINCIHYNNAKFIICFTSFFNK